MIEVDSIKEYLHVFTNHNDNIPLNRLLVQATKQVGALKEGVSYTMDMDASLRFTLQSCHAT